MNDNEPGDDRTAILAAFYGLTLRQRGYSRHQAVALVIERYPATQPILEKLARPPVLDPLQGEERHLSAVLGGTRGLGRVE